MTPEIDISPFLRRDLLDIAFAFESCEQAEARAVDGEIRDLVCRVQGWASFAANVTTSLRQHHHVVVRGMPNELAVLLLTAAAAGNEFRTYRSNKVVKRFTLSPWTRSLSHTTAEGHFHTDLNTAPVSPRVTAIQCVDPDPNAPRHGELRVAELASLLSYLSRKGYRAALQFLCDDEAVMVSDTEPDAWRGCIVSAGEIRFHPETLRAAQRRFGHDGTALEQHLSQIKEAALAVSSPIHLDAGDILFVSNRRALHYRGACSVRFREYPSDFESRTVHVLHLMDESA